MVEKNEQTSEAVQSQNRTSFVLPISSVLSNFGIVELSQFRHFQVEQISLHNIICPEEQSSGISWRLQKKLCLECKHHQ